MKEGYLGDEQVARVRAAVDLVALIGERTTVRKAGGHHVACCLFHSEKTPSMQIYDDGHYHCYGCKAHGDAIDLIVHLDGITFQAAVEQLARKVGITLEYQAGGPDPKTRDRRQAALAALVWSQRWFTEQLPREQQAQHYLTRGRGFTADTIAAFGFGWAPGRSAMRTAALAAGHGEEALLDAGLVKDGRDVFWQRITLPIHDAAGHVVGFTARRLPGDDEGDKAFKYVNTAETLVFRKGDTVFNIHRARGHAKELGGLVLVEGAWDAVAMVQGGHPNAVACMGTALTDEQLNQIGTVIAKNAGRLITLYDADRGGQEASAKTARAALKAGIPARVASLAGDHKDPADALLGGIEGGPEAVANALVSARMPITYLCRDVAPTTDGLEEDDLWDACDDLLEVVASMPDPEKRLAAAESVAGHLGLRMPSVRARLSRLMDEIEEVASLARGAKPGEGAGEPDVPEPPQAIPPLGGSIPSPDADFELNEIGNALRFAARFGDRVRFCHTWGKWLIWKGTHWQVDDVQAVDTWMAEALDVGCRAEIERAKTERRRIELARWRTKYLGDRGIVNSLSRAQALPMLGVVSSGLDARQDLFAVANGVINLRTGELLPHDPQLLITRVAPIDYDPAATDARWEAFLDELTAGDRDVIAYLQRCAGYAMTGLTSEQSVMMLAGPGGTGKSTFTLALIATLGSYAATAPFDLFISKHNETKPWDLARFEKVRLVVSEETADGKRWAADVVKKLSGGARVNAEAKHKDPFEYTAIFKLWFVTNHPPWVSDREDAFWRRMHMVRFEVKPKKKDRNLQTYLTTSPAARKAVLAWMVKGAVAWWEGAKDGGDGLRAPAVCIAATEQYRAEQDPILDFLKERTVWRADHLVTRERLYQAYSDHCKDSGKDPISKRGFALRIQERGADGTHWLREAKCASLRAWRGLRLRDDGEDPIRIPSNVPGSLGSVDGPPSETPSVDSASRVDTGSSNPCLQMSSHVSAGSLSPCTPSITPISNSDLCNKNQVKTSRQNDNKSLSENGLGASAQEISNLQTPSADDGYSPPF